MTHRAAGPATAQSLPAQLSDPSAAHRYTQGIPLWATEHALRSDQGGSKCKLAAVIVLSTSHQTTQVTQHRLMCPLNIPLHGFSTLAQPLLRAPLPLASSSHPDKPNNQAYQQPRDRVLARAKMGPKRTLTAKESWGARASCHLILRSWGLRAACAEVASLAGPSGCRETWGQEEAGIGWAS